MTKERTAFHNGQKQIGCFWADFALQLIDRYHVRATCSRLLAAAVMARYLGWLNQFYDIH